jgi:hypothetical protein
MTLLIFLLLYLTWNDELLSHIGRKICQFLVVRAVCMTWAKILMFIDIAFFLENLKASIKCMS